MPDERYANRNGVISPQEKHSAMVLCVALCAGSHRASYTFHDLSIVDVCVVSHYSNAGIKVVHLAVYEVVAGFGDSDNTPFKLYGAQLVTNNPVTYEHVNYELR